MKYKKLPVRDYKTLGLYPVYVNSIYKGREPFKIVGIRENQIELEGDFSGGTFSINKKDWFADDECFVVTTVCPEQSKPGGCQISNINCCGGGSLIWDHVEYWKDLLKE